MNRSAATYRLESFVLRPKWIGFHLLVLGGIVGMVYLGLWQLDRLDQKQAFNARVEQRYHEPPVPIDELLVPDAAIDDLEWRPVTTRGTFIADGSVQIVNRSQFGRAGANTVTPLRLADGRVLLVNRGFLPLDVDPPSPPTGTVELTGRLRTTQTRGFGQLGDPADGVLEVAQRIDIDRLSEQIDAEVVPMYLDVYESVPAESEPQPEPVIAPELDEGNHLGYAVQWFIFVAVAVGWVLAVRRSLRTHRAEREAPTDQGGEPGALSDSDSETKESRAEEPVRLRRYTDR